MSRCAGRQRDGRQCGAPPIKGEPYCLWHSPEREDEAAEARRLGGLRRKRERTVAGTYELATANLRRHRIAQAEVRLAAGRRWTDLDFVFTTANGTPLGSHNVTRYFQAALKRAGLPHQRFHDLRHASATLGLESGESLYEVSQRLGHANIATTGDIYSHVTPAMQERSAARMDHILTG